MNFVRKRENSMKKSVDDLLNSSQDVINQAISLTTQTIAEANKRTPSPLTKKNHKRDKSDVSLLSADAIETDSLQSSSTTGTSPSPETRSQDEKDSKKLSSSSGNSKLAEKAKRKAWYSMIYPSYKSRSEEFKKLFNFSEDIPSFKDERLVVDYSCAIQKDILVHGRLYVSQNFLCFHANIIVYETRFVIRWKDVTAISKEKVAKVIPNAILITTESDKYFLTSFTSREKAYVILFRLWQNALMSKPMNSQELWQSVHNCYGDQLGLTSDDEDYIDPYEKVSAESVSEEPETSVNSSEKKHKKSSSSSSSAAKETIREIQQAQAVKLQSTSNNVTEASKSNNSSPEQCPTDMSDSTDSESAKMDFVNDAECNSMHEGRQLVHTILPISIEAVFGLLFHKSKFFTEFHRMRKTTDLNQGEWEDLPDGTKQRVISLNVAITQVVGPKSSHVTETQVMRSCSKPGKLYSIDATSVNAGIPYADSFYVVTHYCMKKTVDDSTVMSVHASIRYKKSVWGVVKGFIEKNTWLGLEEFYESLSKALMSEYCLPPAKSKSRRTRKGSSLPQTSSIIQPSGQAVIQNDAGTTIPSVSGGHTVRNILKIAPGSVVAREKLTKGGNQEALSMVVIFLLIALIAFNVILYVKLWRLDDHQESFEDVGKKFEILRSSSKSTEEWLKLLKIQEQLHAKELKTWQNVIESAIQLLRKTENSLAELQNLILTHRAKLNLDRLASVGEVFIKTEDGS